MSKRDPLSQAQKLEEKIKEMQKKQQDYIAKAEREIGKHLMIEWDIEDIEQAKEIIETLKPDVEKLFKKESQEESKHEVLNEQNG